MLSIWSHIGTKHLHSRNSMTVPFKHRSFKLHFCSSWYITNSLFIHVGHANEYLSHFGGEAADRLLVLRYMSRQSSTFLHWLWGGGGLVEQPRPGSQKVHDWYSKKRRTSTKQVDVACIDGRPDFYMKALSGMGKWKHISKIAYQLLACYYI